MRVWEDDRGARGIVRFRVQIRAGLLVAAVVFLVSGAACTSTKLGITSVGFDEDGALITRASSLEDPNVGEQSVETPRGIYTIEGSDVVRTIGGRKEVAYSAAYLQEPGNINLQTHATMHLAPRRVTTGPYSIAYDERTGNVVVAMGLQGIVVGTPDGRWTREAAGRFAPTDFSIVPKLLLLRDWELWLVAVAAALSFTALAMVLAEPASALETVSSESTASANRSNSRISAGYWIIGVFVLINVLGIVWQRTADLYFVGFFVHVASLVLIIPLAPIALSRKNGRVMVSVFAIMASTIGMVYYMEEGQGLLGPLLSFGGGALGLGLAALVGAASYMELRRGLFVTSFFDGGLLPVIAAAVGGMLALIVLSFFLWVQLGIHLGAAMFSAIGSMSLTAFILWKYLKGRMPTNP